MDYGKFKYENAQKAREARRNQTNVIIKEMKLRPKIDAHDYETKKGHVVRFLRAGDKVKITIMFRGREQHRPELGFRLLQRLAELAEHLQTSIEQERANIAREIHDDLGGNLTAIKMALAMLSRRLPQDDAALQDKAAYVDSLVDRTIDAVHRISLD
eukprot:gene1540-1924_t